MSDTFTDNSINRARARADVASRQRHRRGRLALAAAVAVMLSAGAAWPAAAADVSPDGFGPPDYAIEDDGEPHDQLGTTIATGDFNGDGYEDTAIGVPAEDIDGVPDAGAVNVIYGSFDGLSATVVPDQLWHQNVAGVEDAAELGDRFGSQLTVGDFNGDGLDDLAVSTKQESVSGVWGAGAVNVIYGSTGGLSATVVPDQLWHQDVEGVEDVVETDGFGSDLAAADFNADGYDDLAIGAYFESVEGKSYAGAVNVIHGAGGGLSATVVPDQLWHQNVPGVEDVLESGDHFGLRLAVGNFNGDRYADLAVGVPDEDVGSVTNAGAVNVIHGSFAGLSATRVPDQIWSQDAAGVEDVAEVEDRFGSSLAAGSFDGDSRDDLAIGVPLETVGHRINMYAGAVNVIYGAAGGLSVTEVPSQLWHQDSGDVEGVVAPGDQFGDELAVGRFNGDDFDDLAIGVPLEYVGGDRDAGAVNVIHGSKEGLSAVQVPDQLWHQDVADVDDEAEALDHFGRGLAAGRFNGDGYDDLAIGVPDEDVGVENIGAMHVIHGTGGGLSASPLLDQFWHQDS